MIHNLILFIYVYFLGMKSEHFNKVSDETYMEQSIQLSDENSMCFLDRDESCTRYNQLHNFNLSIPIISKLNSPFMKTKTLQEINQGKKHIQNMQLASRICCWQVLTQFLN